MVWPRAEMGQQSWCLSGFREAKSAAAIWKDAEGEGDVCLYEDVHGG